MLSYKPAIVPKIRNKQECSTCPFLIKCWGSHTNAGKPISTQNILINILVCRLQMGIDRDKSVANLLSLLRPGMVRLISHVKQQSGLANIDFDQLLSDMQSKAIEYLLYDYKIGDRGRATPYLFDPHHGFLVKWIRWILGKNSKFYFHHELINITDDTHTEDGDDEPYYDQASSGTLTKVSNASWSVSHQGNEAAPYSANDDDDNTFVQTIMQIVDDGVTLNRNEYRVLKFCLANSNESNDDRLIDGLHIHLAQLMNVSRPRITRLYARAKVKLSSRYAEIEEIND